MPLFVGFSECNGRQKAHRRLSLVQTATTCCGYCRPCATQPSGSMLYIPTSAANPTSRIASRWRYIPRAYPRPPSRTPIKIINITKRKHGSAAHLILARARLARTMAIQSGDFSQCARTPCDTAPTTRFPSPHFTVLLWRVHYCCFGSSSDRCRHGGLGTLMQTSSALDAIVLAPSLARLDQVGRHCRGFFFLADVDRSLLAFPAVGRGSSGDFLSNRDRP